MHIYRKTILRLLPVLLFCPLAASALEVRITEELEAVDVIHAGKKITIQRQQTTDNTVNPDYAWTSRKCPPFCIQPMHIAPGVETIGELELLEYLRRGSTDDSVLVIDSRTPDWVRKGTIPGSVNIPWTALSAAEGADPFAIADLMQEKFGVKTTEGLWDFTRARTLVLFCNGMWCGQSPANIRSLLKFGYPAHKLKWYRGGMQDWEILGLTVVK